MGSLKNLARGVGVFVFIFFSVFLLSCLALAQEPIESLSSRDKSILESLKQSKSSPDSWFDRSSAILRWINSDDPGSKPIHYRAVSEILLGMQDPKLLNTFHLMLIRSFPSGEKAYEGFCENLIHAFRLTPVPDEQTLRPFVEIIGSLVLKMQDDRKLLERTLTAIQNFVITNKEFIEEHFPSAAKALEEHLEILNPELARQFKIKKYVANSAGIEEEIFPLWDQNYFDNAPEYAKRHSLQTEALLKLKKLIQNKKNHFVDFKSAKTQAFSYLNLFDHSRDRLNAAEIVLYVEHLTSLISSQDFINYLSLHASHDSQKLFESLGEENRYFAFHQVFKEFLNFTPPRNLRELEKEVSASKIKTPNEWSLAVAYAFLNSPKTKTISTQYLHAFDQFLSRTGLSTEVATKLFNDLNVTFLTNGRKPRHLGAWNKKTAEIRKKHKLCDSPENSKTDSCADYLD